MVNFRLSNLVPQWHRAQLDGQLPPELPRLPRCYFKCITFSQRRMEPMLFTADILLPPIHFIGDAYCVHLFNTPLKITFDFVLRLSAMENGTQSRSFAVSDRFSWVKLSLLHNTYVSKKGNWYIVEHRHQKCWSASFSGSDFWSDFIAETTTLL